MNSILVVAIVVFGIAIIGAWFFVKSFLDLADEVVEERREKRKQMYRREAMMKAMLLSESEEDGCCSEIPGKNVHAKAPSPGYDPAEIVHNMTPTGDNHQCIEYSETLRQQEDSFRRAGIGYEFGGTNCDLNLNPTCSFMNDEIMGSWFNDSFLDAGSPFESGVDSFGSGFNDPFGA